SFRTFKETSISRILHWNYGFVVPQASPARTSAEFVALAKGNPKFAHAEQRKIRNLRSRSVSAANVQCHQRVELRGLHHCIDLNLFVSCADAPPARTDLDGWYPQLVIDVGIRPDAGAVRRFRLDPFAEEVAVNFFG